MTRDEMRIRNKKRRRKEVARKKMMLLLTIAFVVVLGSLSVKGLFASAHVDNQNNEYKYYKSIVIEDGDSLWSIATEYADNHSSIKTCLNEIVELNKLTSRTIHTGQHLVVPYYDAQFK